jgi:hypothetical protein
LNNFTCVAIFYLKEMGENTGLKSGRHSLWWGRKGERLNHAKWCLKNKTS